MPNINLEMIPVENDIQGIARLIWRQVDGVITERRREPGEGEFETRELQLDHLMRQLDARPGGEKGNDRGGSGALLERFDCE
ncbi:MAG: hypothetical protein ACOC2Q_01630 [Spirochaetota bacterium]